MYLCKFDDSGNRTEARLSTEFTDEQIEEMKAGGYIAVPDDEWAFYSGDNGMGDNGTGYIRDTETGKPVSAPPIPIEEIERADKIARIVELKQLLTDTDYVAIKIAEGEATKESYYGVLAQRRAWRAEINDLEAQLDA